MTLPRVDARVQGSGPHVLVAYGGERKPLFFGQSNAKLPAGIFTLSLPAGYTCPNAKDCHSRAHRTTGRIHDGRDTVFRCYAATMEARHSSVRRSRWRNYELLRACKTQLEMTRLLLDSLTPFARVVRVHDSGDFFSQRYFDAWLEVAKERPDTHCYAYLKALPYWVRRLDVVGNGREPGKLTNFALTASLGGRRDDLAERYGLKTARVVYSVEEADRLGLEIDHDDHLAMAHGGDFALLIHGTQPPGSDAGRAVRVLRDAGWSGYGKTPLPVVN